MGTAGGATHGNLTSSGGYEPGYQNSASRAFRDAQLQRSTVEGIFSFSLSLDPIEQWLKITYALECDDVCEPG